MMDSSLQHAKSEKSKKGGGSSHTEKNVSKTKLDAHAQASTGQKRQREKNSKKEKKEKLVILKRRRQNLTQDENSEKESEYEFDMSDCENGGENVGGKSATETEDESSSESAVEDESSEEDEPNQIENSVDEPAPFKDLPDNILTATKPPLPSELEITTKMANRLRSKLESKDTRQLHITTDLSGHNIVLPRSAVAITRDVVISLEMHAYDFNGKLLSTSGGDTPMLCFHRYPRAMAHQNVCYGAPKISFNIACRHINQCISALTALKADYDNAVSRLEPQVTPEQILNAQSKPVPPEVKKQQEQLLRQDKAVLKAMETVIKHQNKKRNN